MLFRSLVGQIQDEFDQEKPLAARMSETSWEIAGTLPLHELEEIVGQPFWDARIEASDDFRRSAAACHFHGETLRRHECEFSTKSGERRHGLLWIALHLRDEFIPGIGGDHCQKKCRVAVLRSVPSAGRCCRSKKVIW